MSKENEALNNLQWLICLNTHPNHIMYEEELALNNQQWLICLKPNQTKPNQTKSFIFNIYE